MEKSDQYREWALLLNERKARKQTVRDFCSDHNITEHCYYYWRKKIADTESEQSGFTEIAHSPSHDLLLEIEVDRVRVSLYRTVSTAYVSSLLKELREN